MGAASLEPGIHNCFLPIPAESVRSRWRNAVSSLSLLASISFSSCFSCVQCTRVIILLLKSVSRRRRRQPTLPLWEIVRHSVRSGKGKKNSSRKGCPPTICIAGQPRWKPLTRAPVNQPYLSLPSLLCEITIVARNPRNLRTLFRDLHRISVLFREIRDLGSVSAPASTWNVVENCGRCFKSVLPGRCPRSFVFKRVSRSRLRSYALLRACLYSWIANSKVKWLCIQSRKITWAITRSRRYRL